MKKLPGDRIVGVETEFGTLVDQELLPKPEDAVELIKEFVFREARLGVLDLQARDEVFEPAQSGGFLMNGARLYIDAVGSHLEYATAECRSLKDLIANDRAGQKIITRAIRDMDLSDAIDVYNNSIDHFGGHTFGCHENYLVKASDDLFNVQVHLLYPFLVTRQIFAGVGRVGGHILGGSLLRPDYFELMENPIDTIWVSNIYGVHPDESVDFQLSQRADHILKPIATRVRFNRAIINPKWEHFYSHDEHTRLHILFGEPNQNEYAYALKIGTTMLVLDLLEDDLIPVHVILENPVEALKQVSRDPSYKWQVTRLDGTSIGAIELQRIYLQAAQVYKGSSEQVDWILTEWEAILEGLEKDPLALGDRIDWVAKREIVEEYRQAEGLTWQDDALHSVDLEYHNIDPDKSLFKAYQLTKQVRNMVKEVEAVDAMTSPPQNTRAKGRGQLVERVLSDRLPKPYSFDWNAVIIDRDKYFDFSDPFNPKPNPLSLN